MARVASSRHKLRQRTPSTRAEARVSRITSDTRTNLLAVARDLFLSGGEFSLRDVARRAGVSPAAVYRHFDDKGDLLDAVCERGFQGFSGYLMTALRETDPAARLFASGEQYRRFGLENPFDYRFMFMNGLAAPRRGDGDPCAPDATFQFLVDRVRECMAVDALREGDPEAVAVTIWAHVHGLVSLRLASHLDAVGDDDAFAIFYRESLGRLLSGLGAESRGSRAPSTRS